MTAIQINISEGDIIDGETVDGQALIAMRDSLPSTFVMSGATDSVGTVTATNIVGTTLNIDCEVDDTWWSIPGANAFITLESKDWSQAYVSGMPQTSQA